RTELFALLSARDNVALAVAAREGPYRVFRAPPRAEYSEADTVLGRVGLAGREDAAARALSHGERRQLELAVALAHRPRVLLLDEPTAGMSPLETARIAELIAGLDRALTIRIVEHDMDVVFRLADRVTVLHEGRVIADGTAADVRGDVRVHDVYLGKAVTVARARRPSRSTGSMPTTARATSCRASISRSPRARPSRSLAGMGRGRRRRSPRSRAFCDRGAGASTSTAPISPPRQRTRSLARASRS